MFLAAKREFNQGYNPARRKQKTMMREQNRVNPSLSMKSIQERKEGIKRPAHDFLLLDTHKENMVENVECFDQSVLNRTKRAKYQLGLGEDDSSESKQGEGPIGGEDRCAVGGTMASAMIGNKDTSAEWDEKFKELMCLTNCFRHRNVPQTGGAHSTLGAQVARQSFDQKGALQSKPCTLTETQSAEVDLDPADSLRNGKQKSQQSSFSERLQELKDYKVVHGTTRVANNKSGLYYWVVKQRTEYRLMKEGKPSYMTESRISALQAIGFEWRIYKGKAHVPFSQRLEELREYRATHGTLQVPKSSDSLLHNWIATQRGNYKTMKEGKPSSMTECRIAALEEIGFEWNPNTPGTKWRLKLDELREYKATHGTTQVAKKENSTLYHWAADQRWLNKANKMTATRISDLNSLGFVWTTTDRPMWPERLEEFRQHLATQGTPKVSKKGNIQLHNWVKYQRRQYRAKMEGKPSALTEARMSELNSLGFEWTVENGKGKMKSEKQNLSQSTELFKMPAESGSTQPLLDMRTMSWL